MIAPDNFYTPDEHPSGGTRKRMWRNIRKELDQPHRATILGIERRSFLYGMAASVILYFTSVGIYTTAQQSIRNSQPSVVRLDAAYQSAIEQFEHVMPKVVDAASRDGKRGDYIAVRKTQLRSIDEAIAALKSESVNGDISPLIQKRLRQLYSMKLNVLQEMIENGELEL